MSNAPLGAMLRPLRALFRLAEAHEQATALEQDTWQFALSVAEFLATAININDLRYLKGRKWIELRTETTKANGGRRTFRRARDLTSRSRAAAVVTFDGLKAAESFRQLLNRPVIQPLPFEADSAEIPCWDAAAGELSFHDKLIKSLSRRADCGQRLLLQVFHELGWPRHIDDPLPPKQGVVEKTRLNNLIKKLNAKQVNHLIEFHGDGTGQGICWKPHEVRHQKSRRAAPQKP